MIEDKKVNGSLLPLSKVLPSIITLLAVGAGFTSIKFTFASDWSKAISLILVALFMDGLDGRVARLLSAESSFGAYLDSIADFLNFGVAPALMIYFCMLQVDKTIGWLIAMLYTICLAIRLAKFNVGTVENKLYNKEEDDFFRGVPAPASAVLVMIPIMLYLELGSEWSEMIFYVNIEGLIKYYVIFISFLSVSNIPTISFKKVYIKRNMVSFVMVFCSIFVVLCITHPWTVFPVLGLIYMLTIPIFCLYKKNINTKR